MLKGSGIDIGNLETMQDDNAPRIVSRGATGGMEKGGRIVMKKLLQEQSRIDVIDAICMPSAKGVCTAIEASGRQKNNLIVSINDGSQGIEDGTAGMIDATIMQYPLQMARLGIKAVIEFARTGKRPSNRFRSGFSVTPA